MGTDALALEREEVADALMHAAQGCERPFAPVECGIRSPFEERFARSRPAFYYGSSSLAGKVRTCLRSFTFAKDGAAFER
jgi:hypothetical protein